jgi:chemotaxis protein CheD
MHEVISLVETTYFPQHPLPGFEHINRYWDPHLETPAVKILPGECYVSLYGEMIVTVLGSCIAACIRDRVLGIGGMNHFMLPVQGSGRSIQRNNLVNPDLCYGNWAMEFLINAILRQGGRRENLEIKLFGGGRVLSGLVSIDIGQRNIEFVLDYLTQEKFAVTAKDLGGKWPRKVLYFPDTGAVKMRRLHTLANDTIQQRERAYMELLSRKPPAADVELF